MTTHLGVAPPHRVVLQGSVLHVLFWQTLPVAQGLLSSHSRTKPPPPPLESGRQLKQPLASLPHL